MAMFATRCCGDEVSNNTVYFYTDEGRQGCGDQRRWVTLSQCSRTRKKHVTCVDNELDGVDA